jgi:hypothetical protein
MPTPLLDTVLALETPINKPTNLLLTQRALFLYLLLATTYLASIPQITRTAQTKKVDAGDAVVVLANFLSTSVTLLGLYTKYKSSSLLHTPLGIPGRNLDQVELVDSASSSTSIEP